MGTSLLRVVWTASAAQDIAEGGGGSPVVAFDKQNAWGDLLVAVGEAY